MQYIAACSALWFIAFQTLNQSFILNSEVWEEIVNARAVPLTRLRSLTTVIAARLEDKSSIVRKNAITVLTNLIKKNPYSDKVCCTLSCTLFYFVPQDIGEQILTNSWTV